MKKVVLFLCLLLIVGRTAHAQDFSGIAQYMAVEGEDIVDGSILAITADGRILKTTTEYSQDMFGVAQANPAVAWSEIGKQGAIAVARSGTAKVLVTLAGGEINAGDWITSSEEEGVGMKANRPGFVLGRATEPLVLDEGTDRGLLSVNISLQFVAPELSDDVSPFSPGGALATLRSGYSIVSGGQVHFAVRYMLALLALIVSLIFAYWIFTKTATNSVTAIGRNPLARRSILFSAIISGIVALAIVGAGIGLALYILAL